MSKMETDSRVYNWPDPTLNNHSVPDSHRVYVAIFISRITSLEVMFKGGRPKGPIWDHFNLITQDSKKSAQCKLCLSVQSIKACRMKTHHQKCAANIKVSF